MKRSRLKRTRIKRASKKAVTRKELDGLVRKIVMIRDGGKCRKCGREAVAGRGGGLEAAHIMPKGQWKSMRFVVDNVMMLCHRHHFHWWHQDILGSAEWFDKEFGVDYYPRLRERARKMEKLDLKQIKIDLQAELAGLQG